MASVKKTVTPFSYDNGFEPPVARVVLATFRSFWGNGVVSVMDNNGSDDRGSAFVIALTFAACSGFIMGGLTGLVAGWWMWG